MKLVLALILIIVPVTTQAWDGIIRDSGDDIEIANASTVHEGENIEYYDNDSDETREAEVDSISLEDGSANIKVIDNDSGETSVLEME